ncbi:MAG: 30S ribosomal protein S21 [Patescibacteria group bacterium]|nr:30S ribosomal protein S21 [Patescibacteria group bacterium]
MAIEIKKQQGETTRGLIRRFSRKVQQSGVLIRARKDKFHEKEKTKRERRDSAVRRVKIGKEKEKLRKMGLLEEEPKWKRKR